MNKNRNRIAAMMMVAAITVSSVAIPVEAAVVNSNVSSKVVENTRGTEKDVTDGVVLNEENFPDAEFRKILSEELSIQEGDTITLNILENTKILNLSKREEGGIIRNLTGISNFVNLESLYCNKHNIEKIDLSKNTKLEEFRCESCNIKELKLDGNINLKDLDCTDNKIENLDISKFKELERLSCSANNISELDLSKNLELITLECNNNNISSIDLSKNTKLSTLNLRKNNIIEINLNNNNNLEEIDLSENKLKEIDLKGKVNLNNLKLDDNELKEIDLSENKKLERISLNNNKLRNLDLSKVDNLKQGLKDIGIYGNEIGKFEVNNYQTEYSNLQEVNLENNKLDEYIDLNKEFGITAEDIKNNKVDLKTEGIIIDGTKLKWIESEPFEIKYIYNCGGKDNEVKLEVIIYLDGEYTPDLDSNGNKPITPSTPSVKPDTNHSKIAGGDRYETAAKIADQMGSYDTVILVNSDKSMADGLSAASLSGKKNAPILLVKKDNIPKSTMDRINRAKNVYIIGGENTISKKVENQLENKNITRIAGKDRYDTSKKIAAMLGGYEKAFIVNGVKGEADAMSVSAAAAKYGAPILLTNGKTSIHENKDGVQYFAIGGRAVVSNELADKYSADRIAGVDRYATNKKIMDEFYYESKKVYFAKGDTLVDALTASTLAKDNGIVLVSKKSNHTLLNGKETVQVGGMDFTINFK
ncbi:cell wall-binding repeat-containing protein [Peptacetobacter sp.]|uniref:cell wall-binding repeat-containing protein n=1 Tax=Peptacetobacter sp. TaxID=2991975 RepID=UPI00262912DB|nr:cell wall-binding repeat-containing protein [Peptacetobacter sp.]